MTVGTNKKLCGIDIDLELQVLPLGLRDPPASQFAQIFRTRRTLRSDFYQQAEAG